MTVGRFPWRLLPASLPFLALPLLAGDPGLDADRWAVVVGVGDYLHLEDVEGGDLHGAAGDARAFRDVLVHRWGFPERNVRLLLDGAATQRAMEEAVVGWLGSRVAPGDNVVIYFAGLGSQVWDEDGDEEDGLDETLAPADVSPTRADRDITDDTFTGWLEALPSTNVVVVLDQATSGTGGRERTAFSRARVLGRDVGSLPLPGETARDALPRPALDETGFEAGGAHVVELSAAHPHQAAVETWRPGTGGAEPFHAGAFTRHLVRALWRAPADASYEEVLADVARALERDRFGQAPELSSDEGPRLLPLFFTEGGSEPAPPGTVPVERVEGDRARLGGGRILGVTPGSLFSTPSGATLVADSVGAEASGTRVVRGAPEAGELARLVGRPYPLRPLGVGTAGLDSATAAALDTALVDHPMVGLVRDEASFSDLLLRRRGDSVRVVGADGFVRHPGIPARDQGALTAFLLREAAAARLAGLDNPVQGFSVEVRLEGDATSFAIGEAISFHVTSEAPGYLTLVDLGTDGTVVLLFPNEHQPAPRIEAGETLSFPTGAMGFDLQAFPPTGPGMVRAFVTPRPLQLPMEGEYPEGDERFADALARAVLDAAGGVDGAVRLDGWATAAVVYEVRD